MSDGSAGWGAAVSGRGPLAGRVGCGAGPAWNCVAAEGGRNVGFPTMTTEPVSPDLSATTPASERGVVVPDKPALEGLEQTWSQRWKDDDTYAFDRTKSRAEVYSIDTPPPTV